MDSTCASEGHVLSCDDDPKIAVSASTVDSQCSNLLILLGTQLQLLGSVVQDATKTDRIPFAVQNIQRSNLTLISGLKAMQCHADGDGLASTDCCRPTQASVPKSAPDTLSITMRRQQPWQPRDQSSIPDDFQLEQQHQQHQQQWQQQQWQQQKQQRQEEKLHQEQQKDQQENRQMPRKSRVLTVTVEEDQVMQSRSTMDQVMQSRSTMEHFRSDQTVGTNHTVVTNHTAVTRASQLRVRDSNASCVSAYRMGMLNKKSVRVLEVEAAIRLAEELDHQNAAWTTDVYQRMGSISVDGRFKKTIIDILHWSGFDIGIGVVIVLNAATIGMEAELKSLGKKRPQSMDIIESIFLSIYFGELFARVYCFGMAAFTNNFVKLDFVLVFFGLFYFLTSVCKLPVSSDILRKMVLFRLVRLARLARLVRLMSRFKVLWELVQGLMASMGSLFWTFCIISLFLYIFSVVALELVHRDDACIENCGLVNEYNEAVDDNFVGMFSTFLTLARGLTLDSFGGVYRPLVMYNPYLVTYFVFFLLLCPIALMNLITAVMVNCAFAQSAQDREVHTARRIAEKKKMVLELETLFDQLDADGSGYIDMEELRGGSQELLDCLKHVVMGSDVEQIFCNLDYDDSGELEISEFCDGLMNLQDGKAIELKGITRQLKAIRQELHDAGITAPAPLKKSVVC